MIVETPNLLDSEEEESFLFFLLNLQFQRLSYGDDMEKYIYGIFVDRLNTVTILNTHQFAGDCSCLVWWVLCGKNFH